MNGISLLIALATLGVDVRWETGPNQQLIYTVRIETLVHQELRNGQAVVSTVGPEDRGIRKFRIAMGPKPQVERAVAVAANEVQYGWRPSPENPRQVDYFVQVLPERLETLAQGIPIQCEVHPDVPQIDFIYFFQGNAELPRTLPVGLQPPPRNQSVRSTDQGVRPAANSVTQPSNDSRFGTPSLEGSQYASNNNAARNNVSDSASAANQRNYESDRGWQAESTGNSLGGRTYGPEPAGNYGSQPSLPANNGYSRLGDEMIQVPRAGAQDPYRYAGDPYPDNRYAARTEAGRPPGNTLQQPAYPGEAQQARPPANDDTTKELVALIKEQQSMLQQQQKDSLAKQVLPQQPYAAIATPAPAQSLAAHAAVPDEGLRTPLVVTMLALFASLCANAYIGWLAWSFFWRFRNAASDLARAQTAATMRSAA